MGSIADTGTSSMSSTLFPIAILLLFAGGHAILAPFRNDSFSQNVLVNYTNGEVDAIGQSAVFLPDGSAVIAGRVTYPAGLATHPKFADYRDIVVADNSSATPRSAAIIIRVSFQSKVLWAIRTLLCDHDTTFSVVSHGESLYVAGGTINVPLSLQTESKCCNSTSGMVVVKLDKNGEIEKLVVQGDAGERYTGMTIDPAEASTLVLTAYSPSGTGAFSKTSAPPSIGGLSAARVSTGDLNLLARVGVSNGTLVNSTLVQDTYWDMDLSKDGDRLFIVGRRQILKDWVHSFTPFVLSVNTSTLSVVGERLLPTDLQLSTSISSSPLAEGGVFISYVSRTKNREFLVVRHMANNLTDIPAGNTTSAVFKSQIEQDAFYTRTKRPSVADMHVDNDGELRVLLHVAEIVNKKVDGLETHRKLSNGRPAIVVVTKDMIVGSVAQVQTPDMWEPHALVVGRDEYLVVGADRGSKPIPALSNLLLTGVRRMLVPSPSPSQSIPASPTIFNTSEPEAPACIGKSTSFNGVNVVDVIRGDKRMRMQRHPLLLLQRRGDVRMLCTTWRNETVNTLCATEDHVVRHHGEAMYMRDFCERVRCETRVETPVNFKGACGVEIRAHDGLTVTMHAGGLTAHTAVTAECLMRETRLVSWFFRTL